MSFKSSASVQNIAYHARKTRHLTKQLTKEIFIRTSKFSIFFSLFLANSKGKDKFIALFQYFFQFITACGKHSNIPEIALAYSQRKLPDMVVYYNLKESISSARKVFRLFRFFDQIKGLTKILQTDKPFGFKLLSTFTYACSITYYISDNILWLLGILVRSQVVDQQQKRKWKYRKNFSSFYRVIAYVLILLYSIYLQESDNKNNKQYLKRQQHSSSDNIEAEEKAYRKILQGRRKVRFLLLELSLSALRFVMLTSSLRLKYHENIHPIFVGVCGFCSAVLGFLKAMFEKKIVINIESKDDREAEQHRLNYKTLKTLSSIQTSKFW